MGMKTVICGYYRGQFGAMNFECSEYVCNETLCRCLNVIPNTVMDDKVWYLIMMSTGFMIILLMYVYNWVRDYDD